jgi:hypothetical protein
MKCIQDAVAERGVEEGQWMGWRRMAIENREMSVMFINRCIHTEGLETN